MPQTLRRTGPGLAPHFTRLSLRGLTAVVRRRLVSGLLVLCAIVPVQGAWAEGSIDLIRQEAGFRGALLAHDLSLGLQPGKGQQTVSTHFVFARPGEVLNLASSAQGVGQGHIAFRSPRGVAGRCGGGVGRIADRLAEVRGVAADAVCAVPVEDGEEGIWAVEFIPPNPAAQPDLSRFVPVNAGEPWPAQQADDAWVWAWDVTVSAGPLQPNRQNAQRGRTFVRALPTVIAPRDRPAAGGGVRKTQPWFSAWVIQSADGYQYVFDTNGVRADTLTLMASSRGLVSAEDRSVYATVALEALGDSVFFRSPIEAAGAQQRPRGGEAMKLFYARPDGDLPETARSALLEQEWLRPASPARQQQMTDLEVLADRGLLRVMIEGDGATAAGSGTMANALELFAATASGPDAPVLQVYDNLAPGETLLRLPEDVTGEVVARFTSKLAELHILLPDVHDTGRGMRLRRLNGPKSGAGQMYWNLAPTSPRFDGQPVQSADSLRARAGVAMPDQTHGRVLDLWALLPARNERLIAIPATTGGAAQPVSVAVALPAAPALPTDGFGAASDGDSAESSAVPAPVTAPVTATETAPTTASPEVSSAILIEALNAVDQARGGNDTPAGSAPVDVAATPVSAPVFTPPIPRLRPALPVAPTLPESQPEAPSNTAEASAPADPGGEAVTDVEAVAETAAQPATPKLAPARKARPAVASPAPRIVVRPKPQVRRLIPGETVSFPVGSQPVTSTPGVQLAVPAGYQVYRAPEGWYFLVRVQ